jgi:hypothetical protein
MEILNLLMKRHSSSFHSDLIYYCIRRKICFVDHIIMSSAVNVIKIGFRQLED